MGKRLVDVLVSALLLVVLSPLFLLVAILVRLKLGSPSLFTQTRPGLRGKPFRMVKFRTMTNSVGPDGQPLTDEQRLTRCGRFLRSASLDELPELFNVLVGDMSLVGPRPLLMQYLERYSPEQMRRHDVRPGITGWAQVNGRNNLPWEERFRLDVWYVENRTLLLDLKILWLTVVKVLKRSDVSQDGHVTMTEFNGMSGVIILGTGNHAKVACDILLEMGSTVRGFLGDNEAMHGEELLGFPVLGPIDAWASFSPSPLALGAGSNQLRKEFMTRCEGAAWVTMIHPRANVSRFAQVGEGAMVAFGACVGPLAVVGRGTIINTKASVDHDCSIGDFAHVAVGATLAGTVSLGEGAMVGAGATVIQNLQIGAWATVGAGAAVVRSVPDGVTVIGVPARPKP